MPNVTKHFDHTYVANLHGAEMDRQLCVRDTSVQDSLFKMNTLNDYMVEIYNVETLDTCNGGKVLNGVELISEAGKQYPVKAVDVESAAKEAVQPHNWIVPNLPIDNDSYRYKVTLGVKRVDSSTVTEISVLTPPDLILRNPILTAQLHERLPQVLGRILSLRDIGNYRFMSNNSVDIGEIESTLNEEKRFILTSLEHMNRRPDAVRWSKLCMSPGRGKRKWSKFILLTREATEKLFTMRPIAVTYSERINTVYEALGQNPRRDPYGFRNSVEYEVLNGYGLFYQSGTTA